MRVSIIIPVYNVAPYVEQCIRSVMNQTMTEGVECIIVDDCGQDNSMEIVGRMVAEYEGNIEFRILHHDHNRGLSAARNTGVDAAKGEYVYFLDSDDWIYDYCLDSLNAIADRYPKADFVQGAIFPEDDSLYDWTHGNYNMPHDVDYIDNPCQCRLLLQQIHHLPFMQNRLIKRKFILDNHLYAKEGIIHEDNLWTFLAGKSVQGIAFCKKDTYFYRKSPIGIVSSSSHEILAQGISDVCEEIVRKMSIDRWFDYELRYVLWRIQSIEKLGYDNPFIFMRSINNHIIRKLYDIEKNRVKQNSVFEKLKIWLIRCFMLLLCYIYVLYNWILNKVK